MNRSIGIVMDSIEHIKIIKDSSFAMMLAAQRRGWAIHYIQQTTSTLTAWNHARQHVLSR